MRTLLKPASILAILTASFLAVRGAAQAPAPAVRIDAPAADSYVSGAVIIRATVTPPQQRVERVTFFVDGRQICTVDAPPFQCEWNAGTQLHEHVFRAVASLPDGQRIAHSIRTRGTEYAEAVDVDVIHVTVTVLDNGRLVRGLPREAFRVFDDNIAQPISHFASENVPLELVVAIDVSGSMTDAMADVKDHVGRFLSALRPADRVTLVAFNENFFVLARPSVDLATRLRALDRVRPWGMTALHETIFRSFDLLGTQPGRRGLVLFTDGEDTTGRVTREAVERRAESSDAFLFMIGQGRAIETPGLRALCESLARRSGGRAFFPADSDSLRATFDDIIQELSSQYLVTYTPPANARNGAWHQIRVEVGDGHYTVRARQGYRIGSAPAGKRP